MIISEGEKKWTDEVDSSHKGQSFLSYWPFKIFKDKSYFSSALLTLTYSSKIIDILYVHRICYSTILAFILGLYFVLKDWFKELPLVLQFY